MKFRSMSVDAEKDGPRWAQTGDARTTRVGKVIRKIRVDEIPQFWNILRGDMNFVGPRPERPYFVALLEEPALNGAGNEIGDTIADGRRRRERALLFARAAFNAPCIDAGV